MPPEADTAVEEPTTDSSEEEVVESQEESAGESEKEPEEEESTESEGDEGDSEEESESSGDEGESTEIESHSSPGDGQDLVGEEEKPVRILLDTKDGKEEWAEVPRSELTKAWKERGKSEDFESELKTYRSQVNEMVRKLIDNPMEVLLDAYLNISKGDENAARKELLKHADKYVTEVWDFEQKPESEKKAIRAERELQKTRSELEKLQQEKDSREEARKESQAAEQVLKEVKSGLKQAELPDDKPAIQRKVAEVLYLARQEGHSITAADAAGLVKKQLRKELEERLQSLQGNPDELLGLFPDLAKRIREADLKKVKEKLSTRSSPRKPGGKRESRDSSPEPRIFSSWEDLIKD